MTSSTRTRAVSAEPRTRRGLVTSGRRRSRSCPPLSRQCPSSTERWCCSAPGAPCAGGATRASSPRRRRRPRHRAGRARGLLGPRQGGHRHPEVGGWHPAGRHPAAHRPSGEPSRGLSPDQLQRPPLSRRQRRLEPPAVDAVQVLAAGACGGRCDRTSASTTCATPARRWPRWPAQPWRTSSSDSGTAASTPPCATSTHPRTVTGRSPRRSRGCLPRPGTVGPSFRPARSGCDDLAGPRTRDRYRSRVLRGFDFPLLTRPPRIARPTAASTTATASWRPLRDHPARMSQLAELPQRPYRENPKCRQPHTQCTPDLRTFR